MATEGVHGFSKCVQSWRIKHTLQIDKGRIGCLNGALASQSAATCPGNKSFFTISNAGSRLARCESGRHISANQSHRLQLRTCCQAPASIPRPTVFCQAPCEVCPFPPGWRVPFFPLACVMWNETKDSDSLSTTFWKAAAFAFVGCLGPALGEADGMLKADAYHGGRNRLMSLLR